MVETVVAPFMGAWIETILASWPSSTGGSHPSWVRGLKRRTGKRHRADADVAPFMGAWIETPSHTTRRTRIRRRTLHGCVD